MIPFYAYNQKYFTPRLCIELADKKILAFAFDDFNISKKIFLGLENRLKHLQAYNLRTLRQPEILKQFFDFGG